MKLALEKTSLNKGISTFSISKATIKFSFTMPPLTVLSKDLPQDLRGEFAPSFS